MNYKTIKLLAVFSLLSAGCTNSVIETITYLVNEPKFMPIDAFRSSVNVTTKSVSIGNYGKMCFYNGYIFISEIEKGIHIINNSDPSNPKNIGFIELIGNADLAIRNDKLYADSFIDLVWFDISNPEKPIFEGRLEEVFPSALPSTENRHGIDYSLCYDANGNVATGRGVIVGWELKERTTTTTTTYRLNIDGRWETLRDMKMSSPSGDRGSSIGINGSMSRFSLYKDYLYSVINNYMSIIDLSGTEPVKAVESVYVGMNVETIFSYKENMFMGTPTGMLIYSVANPLIPEYMSSVWHVFGCDPVVVENDIAYITVHSGNLCGQNANELIIYDVRDVKEPKHIVTYAMTKPKGLGVDNGILFVCDSGLKIYDSTNPQTLMANRLAYYGGMDGYDVIPFDNVLMMIADDGLYQYDYSDPTKIRQLSKLPIVK